MSTGKGCGSAAKELLFEVFLLVFQEFPHITIISFCFFVFLVFRDDIQMYGMGLNNLELGFAFRAIQNLALFYFVLVEINLDGAFRTANHCRTSWPSLAPHASVLYYAGESRGSHPSLVSKREFPERPLVGVGGVVIDGGRALLVRRAREPALGEWTIPGGVLEVGETLFAAVERELREETGLIVRVVELIEALERIFSDSEEIRSGPDARPVPSASQQVAPALVVSARPRYHYVILDYLCQRVSGEPAVSAEISDLAFVREEELANYGLTPAATRVLHKAFAMTRARAGT